MTEGTGYRGIAMLRQLKLLDGAIPLRTVLPHPWERLLPAGLPRPGMYWRDESLLLEGTQKALRLAPWPSPSALCRIGAGEWKRADRLAERLIASWPSYVAGEKPFRDPMGLVGGYDRGLARVDENDMSLFWPASYYFELIPETIRKILESHYRGRWIMLLFCAVDERAPELCRSNAGLAYALARWLHKRGRLGGGASREVHELLGMRQKELMGMIGLPATESARRTLAKLDPFSLSPSLMRKLRQVLGEREGAKRLASLPRIESDVLRVVGDPLLRPLVSDRFLQQLATCPRSDPSYVGGKELATAIRQAGAYAIRSGREARFLPLQSIRQIRRLQISYERERSERKWRRSLPEEAGRFPDPPFQGTEAIKPITSVRELLEESLEMGNCVRDYVDEVRSRMAYFYRVVSPTRATLAIMNRGLFGHSLWVPASMLGPRNAELPAETSQAAFLALFSSGPGSEDGGAPC